MFYDRANQTADIATFVELREEPHLHSLKDVEANYSEMERACDLLVDLIIHRNRVAAETTNAEVSLKSEELFRASVKEALQDLHAPVERRVNRAWRDRSYSDPNAEHRLSYATEWAA